MTMCDFKPGDEVVCVDATGLKDELEVGRAYTVQSVGLYPGGCPDYQGKVVVFLEETLNYCWLSDCEIGFRASRFRKLQRRKTDLSIESFLTIRPGFEEPRRPKAPAKRERA